MNTKSVRFRLTLWYSLVFLITSATLFSVFYLVTSQIIFRQTDATLASHGNKVLEVLNRSDSGMHTMLEKQAFLQDFGSIPGMLLVLINNSGQILNSSVGGVDSNSVYQKFYQQAKDSSSPFLADESLNGEPLRFWVAAIHDSRGELFGVVLTAHSTEVINQSLETLFIILSALFILSLIPVTLGGYVLAGQALVPVDRLQAAFNRERQFIGDVAHELKTPLSTLRSSVEIALKKDRPKEEYRRVLNEALIDINQIATTLKNILDLAWSDADSAVMTGEKFNLSEEMAELRDMATKMADAKKITIKGVIANNVFIQGKRDKLGRALLNIIDNAVKFTPDKGTISINLQKKPGKAVVEIKDSGPGITKEDLPRIFERFYRGGKTSKTFGSGLGLAIAQAAIISHHGEIKVASKIGHGTTFTVILPLAVSS